MRRAIAFLTPVGGAAAPSAAAVAWFPVVGALLGLGVGGAWWTAARIWPPAVAAAVAVAADLALTGLLHFDGLVDAADGLLAPMERERRLAVMADPGAGAFGVGVAVVVVLLRWTALTALDPSAWLVAGLWCGSRTVMAVALGTIRPARPGGLTESFRGAPAGPVGAYGMAMAAGLSAAAIGLGPGLASVAAVVVGAGLVFSLAARRVGGVTGDVLGAAGVIGETVGLLVAATRW